jgi:polygalacturonase
MFDFRPVPGSCHERLRQIVLLIGLLPLCMAGCRDGAVTSADKELQGWAQVESILARIQAPRFPDREYGITDYGAVGNGKTVCTKAFALAIEKCHAEGGGRVVVPKGEYLTGPIHLKSNVNLHLVKGATILFINDPREYLPVVHSRWQGVECMNYSPMIYAFEQENVAVTGDGALDGQADNEHWWPWAGDPAYGFTTGQMSQDAFSARLSAMSERDVPAAKRIMGEGSQLRPSFLQFYRCANVLIEGVTIRRAPMWIIHPVLCANVTVRGVSVYSEGPDNTGCGIESSRDVLVEKCVFETASESVALKSGLNREGRRLGIPAENVVVRDCKMSSGGNGFAIGSEISGGARNVFVEKCDMDSPRLDRPLKIKTNSVRGGTIENVYFRNLHFGEIESDVLLIDLYYKEGDRGRFAPRVRNIDLSNVTARRCRHAVYARGYLREPIQAVTMEDCEFGDARGGIVLENVTGVRVSNVMLNGKPFDLESLGTEEVKVESPPDDWAVCASALRMAFDFEQNRAEGWSETKGTWTVVNEGDNAVYSADDMTENRSQAGDVSWTNYRVEARVKLGAVNGNSRVLVCGRYLDGNNYYAAVISDHEGSMMAELHRKRDKKTLKLSREPIMIEPGEWHRLALEMKGETIGVYVDGAPKIVMKDGTFQNGAIALSSFRARATFDDVTVSPIDGDDFAPLP